MKQYRQFTGDLSYDMNKMETMNDQLEEKIYNADVRRNIKAITEIIRMTKIQDDDNGEDYNNQN